MLYEDALRLAQQLRDEMAPACERIEIVGEVRRRVEFVGEIELLAVPKLRQGPRCDLFSAPLTVSCLDDRVREMADGGEMTSRGHWRSSRGRYQRLFANHTRVLVSSVFPGDSWGAAIAIRTGPPEFVDALVGRLYRWGRTITDWKVLERGQVIPCPEEEDFFRLAGAKLIAPWVRGVVEIEPAPAAAGKPAQPTPAVGGGA